MKKIVLTPLRKGFTLIELLVVISIIGVLATLLLANFNATRMRARDAQRKSDLRSIQTALRLYYNDFGHYPEGDSDGKIEGCGSGTTACTWGEAFEITDGNTYMSILPGDPMSTSSTDYNYNYVSAGADVYTLRACLENPSDDKCAKSGGTTVACWTDEVIDGGCTYTVSP